MKKTKLISFLMSAAMLASSLPMMTVGLGAAATKEIPIAGSMNVNHVDEKLADGNYNKYIKVNDITKNSGRVQLGNKATVEDGRSYVLSFKLRSNSTPARNFRIYVGTNEAGNLNVLTGHKYAQSAANAEKTGYSHAYLGSTDVIVINGNAQTYDTGVTMSAADEFGWQTITIPFTVNQESVVYTEDDPNTSVDDTELASFKVSTKSGAATGTLYVGISGGTSWDHCTPYEIDDLVFYAADDEDTDLFGYEGFQNYDGTEAPTEFGVINSGEVSGTATLETAEEMWRTNNNLSVSGRADYIFDEAVAMKAGEVYKIRGYFRLAQYRTDHNLASSSTTLKRESGSKSASGGLGNIVNTALGEDGVTDQDKKTAEAARVIYSEFWREVMCVPSDATTSGITRTAGTPSKTGGAYAITAYDEWEYAEFTYTVASDKTLTAFGFRGSCNGADKSVVTLSTGTVLEYSFDNRTLGYEMKDIEVVKVVTVPAGDADGDGTVEADDLISLERYFANWDGYTEDSVDLSVMDVNGDGKVTPKDAAVIARHLGGWEGYEALPVNVG